MQRVGQGRAVIFSRFLFLLCYSNVFDEFASSTTPAPAASVITSMRKAFQYENTRAKGHWALHYYDT